LTSIAVIDTAFVNVETNSQVSGRAEMANTSSAKKATRKMARKTAINKSRRTSMRGFIRIVEEAIVAGDKGVAQTALKNAQSVIMSAASKGILHKNTASRKISRLAARVKAITA